MEQPDYSLVGEALKEDTYRKACMREGALTLYFRMLQLAMDEEEPIDE